MKKYFILTAFCIFTLPLFAEADIFKVAPGAEEQLSQLLNKPAMVTPAVVTPLGRNWFKMETDAHVFTDQVSVKQVTAALLDIENYNKIFDGKRTKITTSVVQRAPEETIVDFVTIAIVPVVNIRLNTPYRASVKTLTQTDTVYSTDIRQLPKDSETNGKIKQMYAPRYVEEVTINGKKYTYIRMYSIMDTDASILPGAKGTLEKNAGPTSEEAIELLIAGAKTK
uniref:Uncharacterized protein n=1 Tax=uncultured bacterium contig00023 TaxID=1181512 RepID=A0A806KHS3_9BACT|nr:hypothetical protein [uncultured bacterium contig00023]